MNAKKVWVRLLVAVMLLALMFATACETKSAINDADRQALMEQADTFMTYFQGGDYQAMYGMMTTESQRLLDNAKEMAGGYVNVEAIIADVTSAIVKWDFEKARITTEIGLCKTIMVGAVEFNDGTVGKVRLGFRQQDGTWKVCNSSLEK